MHEEYRGFVERPFGLTPDPKYFYMSESHARAFDLLRFAIRRREGLVVVTGDTGTGKTTLCRAILEQLDRRTFATLVLNPFINEDDLLRILLRNFGIVSREGIRRGRLARVSRQELFETLNEFLLSLLSLRAGALLIIDEAQNLPHPVLEQIRILSNLETNKEKLLQIVLVGQLNLKDLLRSPDLRPLDQRVSARCELKPLTRQETAAYVPHRLLIAGGGSVARFEPEGLDLVHEYTKGIPRLVNMVCSRALVGGSSAGTNRVTAGMVTTAAASLDLSVAQGTTPVHLWGRAAAFAAGVAAAALLAAVAAAIWYGAVTLPDRSADQSPSRPVEAQVRQISPDPEPSRSAESPGLPARAAEEPIATSGNTPAALPAPGSPDPSTATPSTVSAPPEGGNYSVLVASFRQGAEAAALLDQLRDLGYRARAVQVETAMRGTWHLVFVGPYNDIDPARLAEARLRQLPGYRDARLVTR